MVFQVNWNIGRVIQEKLEKMVKAVKNKTKVRTEMSRQCRFEQVGQQVNVKMNG